MTLRLRAIVRTVGYGSMYQRKVELNEPFRFPMPLPPP
jgi:hypothetical protein